MKDSQEFLKATLKNPLAVGAIAPSSRALSKLMIKGVEPSESAMILELGVGTGAVTDVISEILPSPDSYLGIEIDKRLASLVQKKYPDLNILNADATSCTEVHEKSDLGAVKYVLSGIPFVSLPKDICGQIFKEIDGFMAKGCMFRTFQYVHGFYTPPAKRLREYMTERYGPMEKSRIVFKNVPPAVTLTWKTS